MVKLAFSVHASTSPAMDGINVPFLLAIAAAAILVLAVAALLSRRLWLMRLTGAFDCYRRTERGRWSPGVARYSTDSLTWYKLFAVGTVGTKFDRRSLALVSIEPAHGTDALGLRGGAVVVRCTLAGTPLALGMSRESSMGFSSWLESIPPGTSPGIH